jgi:hypothetical protein
VCECGLEITLFHLHDEVDGIAMTLTAKTIIGIVGRIEGEGWGAFRMEATGDKRDAVRIPDRDIGVFGVELGDRSCRSDKHMRMEFVYVWAFEFGYHRNTSKASGNRV